jgi:hypothetical protein
VSLDELRTGCVIRFPYLWVREAERGETVGRKPRPVAVGVRIARPKGDDVLVLFPITSRPPTSDRFAAEIPEMEKRRAGLDATLRLWIILDEFNQDILGQSFYLEPQALPWSIQQGVLSAINEGIYCPPRTHAGRQPPALIGRA